MITLNKRELTSGDLFSAVYDEIITDENRNNKPLRLAAMAIANGICYSRYKEHIAAGHLYRSGVDPEIAKEVLKIGIDTLREKDLITSKNHLKVAAFMEAVDGKNVHQMYRTPVTWRSARMGDLKMLPVLSAQHERALADKNMPQVYAALNGMHRVKFKFNEVIKEIPNWNSQLLPHEWAYLENSDWHLKNQSYFSQTFDFRSRMYYRGAFNPSNSGDLGKAMFRFAEMKPLGEDGMKALEIHVANLAGVKGSIKKRVKWTQANAIDLYQAVKGKKVIEIQEITGEKKIYQLYTALHEYDRVQRFGIKSRSGLIIKQDGSCNGIQHAAAILRNRDVAKSVNLCASQENWKPQDLYQEYVDLLKT